MSTEQKPKQPRKAAAKKTVNPDDLEAKATLGGKPHFVMFSPRWMRVIHEEGDCFMTSKLRKDMKLDSLFEIPFSEAATLNDAAKYKSNAVIKDWKKVQIVQNSDLKAYFPKPRKSAAKKTEAPVNPMAHVVDKYLVGMAAAVENQSETNQHLATIAEKLSDIAEVFGIVTEDKMEEDDRDYKIKTDIMEAELHMMGRRLADSDLRCMELEEVIERLEAEKIQLITSGTEREALFDALGSINPLVHVMARTNELYPQLVNEDDPDAIGRIPQLPFAIQDYSTRINSDTATKYRLTIDAAARLLVYAGDLFDQMKDAKPEPEPEMPGPKVVEDEAEVPDELGRRIGKLVDELAEAAEGKDKTTTSPAVPEREAVEGLEGKNENEGGAE